MRKIGLLLCVLTLLFVNNSYGQLRNAITSSSDVSTRNLYLGIGAAGDNYQDTKYSDVAYTGVGGVVEFGFNKNKNDYMWETALKVNFGVFVPSSSDFGGGFFIKPLVYLKYLRRLSNNLYVGGRLDLIDFYLRKTNYLGNNGLSYLNGHHLSASLVHEVGLSSNWSLQSSLDLGLLSYEKELLGFAFSVPQKALEDGDFNYQNDGLINPFNYEYFQLNHIANAINIHTSFKFKYKKRISLIYTWQLRQFSTINDYPLTYGIHNIIIRYNLKHKEN